MTKPKGNTTHKGGHRPVKSLGQNFLVDRNVIDAIVEGAAIGPCDLVIEIGPGTGALTGRLADRARRLMAVEIDSHLIPVLEQQLAGRDNVTIIEGDILKADVTALIAEAKAADPDLEQVHIVGNLPYYITTPIIMGFLEKDVPFASMTVMMQREVGQRMVAEPGTKDYGALSVAVQYYCRVEKVIDVGRESFRPRPKVDSEVLHLVRREQGAVAVSDTKLFFRCIKQGFAMRRKTLLNCFTGFEGFDKTQTEAILEEAGIRPSDRGEVLTIQDYARLADVYGAHRQE